MYIKIYADACPICKGTVKGNFKFKYHCKHCSILFDYRDLIKPLKEVKIVTDNLLIQNRNTQKKELKK